jgi:negative regulator of sigma E activity
VTGNRKIRRLSALAAGAIALAASLSLASADSSGGEAPDGLVFDAMSAPKSVSYTGTVEELRIGSRRSEVVVYSVEHRAPDETKRVYLSPPSLRDDELLTIGVERYWIDGRRHRVVENKEIARDDEIAYDDNYLLMRANYRAVEQSAQPLDGRSTVQVSLINNHTHATTMVVRLDAQTKLVLDKQEFGADGALVGETRFESVRYAGSLPASDFNVPATYTIVQGPNLGTPSNHVDALMRRAGFAARKPTFLPDGFSAVDGNISTVHGIRTLHVLYSDGIRTLSLFEHPGTTGVDMARLHPQTINVDGHDAQYAEEGPMTLLAWSDGTLHYALVGEMRLTELERIASGIGK